MIADASIGSFDAGNMGSSRSDPFGQGSFGASGSQTRVVTEKDLMGCELQARLAGYRSTSVELTGRSAFDRPDVGTIVLRKLGDVEGLTISMTSMQAPKNAKKAYNNGLKNARKQKFDKARPEFEKAVELYPKYAEAWFALGEMHEALEAPQQARDCYHKSLDADQKYMQPHVKLAMLDARTAKWQDVADRTGHVLKMNPYDFPDAYYLNSMANLNLKHFDKAEDSARKAIEMNAVRRFPQVEQILGLVLAYQNNYGEASKHLRRYLELAPNAGNAELVRQQLVEMESFQQQAREAAPGSPAPEQK
jgi:tetratricopeptide (TPR) repeat protein